MRERLERIAVMPFTITCATPSSIAIKEPQRIRKPSGDSIPCSPANKSEFKYGNAANRSLEPSKSLQKEQSVSRPPPVESSMFTFSLSKSHISSKLQRLIKSFRALSQIFVYKEEEGEEMQIGYPTDVKHVAHIGWDGPSGTGKSWMGDLAGTADRSTDFEQPRCSSWMEDAPNWASHDLLGTLGLSATNHHHADAPQFNLFQAADAKAQKSKPVPTESKQRKRNLQMI
jgi:hypothetical protein